MTSKTPEKFDCVKFQREARRRIYEETKHLNGKEYDEYWRKFRATDPEWQRMVAKQRALGRHVPD